MLGAEPLPEEAADRWMIPTATMEGSLLPTFGLGKQKVPCGRWRWTAWERYVVEVRALDFHEVSITAGGWWRKGGTTRTKMSAAQPQRGH